MKAIRMILNKPPRPLGAVVYSERARFDFVSSRNPLSGNERFPWGR
jgi:hypothetical protein